MIDFVHIGDEIIKYIGDEWQAQGHDLTGKFKDSLKYQIKRDSDGVTVNIIGEHYGAIINEGVTADEIKYPFAKQRILGLTQYAKQRMGASDKDAVSIAFAIATKHAREGMPLPSSRRYSKTGERTKFIEAAEKKFKQIIEDNVNFDNNNT